MENSRIGKSTTTQPLNFEVAEQLLAKLKYDKDYINLMFFGCGFYCGLRISDILTLKWSDFTNDKVRIVEKKTGNVRDIELNSKLLSIVKFCFDAYKREKKHDYIFRRRRLNAPSTPMSVQAANKRIRAVFYRYGVATDNPSSHTLRKTFAYRIYELGGKTNEALQYINKILGHKSLATTIDYLGITKQKIKILYHQL